MICPHCKAEITDKEFMSLRGQYAGSKRKSNGGGRPKRVDEKIPLGGSKPRLQSSNRSDPDPDLRSVLPQIGGDRRLRGECDMARSVAGDQQSSSGRFR